VDYVMHAVLCFTRTLLPPTDAPCTRERVLDATPITRFLTYKLTPCAEPTYIWFRRSSMPAPRTSSQSLGRHCPPYGLDATTR
jgi:hypothetical protein